MQHKYQEFSTGNLARQSILRLNSLSTIPQQEFEIDGDNECHDQQDDDLCSDPNKVFIIAAFNHNLSGINLNLLQSTSTSVTGSISETPRGSWATFDLRQTASDPLLPNLLDRLAPEAIDSLNKLRRSELELVSTMMS